MSDRLAKLQHWLATECGLADATLRPASEDASFRRYFRVSTEAGSFVAMDAPPDKEDCGPFLRVQQLLSKAGVHAPAVHAQDLSSGFLLLEDLGDRQYLAELDAGTARSLYGDALSALLAMQRDVPAGELPRYDRSLLLAEMALFPDWLLQRHLGWRLDNGELAILERQFDLLASAALEQPSVFVHRDYHSRNLMVCGEQNPGVIDFQDAVLGPVTYDLVSLLRDCYIAWPAEQVDDWAMGYCRSAIGAGVLASADEAEFLRWFDLMGAQRHLKAAGIFARLNHRDGKSGYLADIPRTLGYIVTVAARRPEIAPLAALIEERVLPALG